MNRFGLTAATIALMMSTAGAARAGPCRVGNTVSNPRAFVTNVTAAGHGSSASAMFFIELDGATLIYAIPADPPMQNYNVDRSIFAAFVAIATNAFANKLPVNVEYNCLQVSGEPRLVLHGLALAGDVTHPRLPPPPPPPPR